MPRAAADRSLVFAIPPLRCDCFPSALTSFSSLSSSLFSVRLAPVRCASLIAWGSGLRAAEFRPVVGEEGPAVVVAPAVGDFQIARRAAFVAEAEGPAESGRCFVGGLDVGFEAMQA